jgi:hypothetical protein
MARNELRNAPVAGILSPLYPAVPVPAYVVIIPDASTFLTLLFNVSAI